MRASRRLVLSFLASATMVAALVLPSGGSALPATYPAVVVEFAPGVSPSVAPDPGDWVPVTQDFTSGTPSRVRDDWSAKWGRFDEFSEAGAGTAELLIANDDGEFDPDGSGTYAADLVPGTWFRIKAGTTTANTDVFYGHVSDAGFQIDVSQHADQWVRVQLVDDLEQLSNTDLPGSVHVIEVEADDPDDWWRLGESSGTVAVDSAGERHLTYYGGATFNSRASLVYGENDSAIAFDDSSGQYAQIDLPTPVTLGSMTWEVVVEGSGSVIGTAVYVEGADAAHYIAFSVNFFSGNVGVEFISDGGVLDSVFSSGANVGDGEPHVVAFTYDSATGEHVIKIDGIERGSTAGTAGKTLGMRRIRVAGGGFTGTIDEVLYFDSALSDARLAAHATAAFEPWVSELSGARITHLLDAVAYDATLRNIDIGQSTVQAADLGGGDAASALREVAKAEAGYVYVDHQDGGKLRFIDRHERWTATASITSQATFGDTGSDVTYSAVQVVNDRNFNRATVQRRNGAAVTVEEPVAVAARRRTYSESGLLFETDAESQSRAERIVAEKSDDRRVPRTITLKPRKSTHSAWAHVFARKVDDRITVEWNPPYGGPRSYDAWIDGIEHRGSSDGLTTTFYLTPVPFGTTGAPYWVWGTSSWETGTHVARWGY